MLPRNLTSPIIPPLDPVQFMRQSQQKQARRRLILQIVLFVLTAATTTMVGGWIYSLCLMSILLFHEMGHYFAARHYGVQATLPYFIPFPLNIFGTFGAVIKMQGLIPHRRALFDIGIMGPLLGVIVALPATVIGIWLSKIIPLDGLGQQTLSLGDSLLFMYLSWIIHGPIPEGFDLLLHPLGFAGWAGLFVTALNLLPIGQLDGGHVIYAIFEKKSLWVYRAIFALFAVLAFFVNRDWLFFVIMVFFLIKLRHPPTLDDSQPLGKTRVLFGIVALLFFLLTFPPMPIKLN